MFNAGAANDRNLAQGQIDQQSGLFNSGAANEAAQFGTAAGNQASMFNAGAQNDNARAQAVYEECLALHRAAGSPSSIALLSLGLGTLARRQGDSARALALAEQCLAIATELSDEVKVHQIVERLEDHAKEHG